MATVIIALATGIAGYIFGAVIGYAEGKTDGAAEVADWYERRKK